MKKILAVLWSIAAAIIVIVIGNVVIAAQDAPNQPGIIKKVAQAK